MPMLAAFLLRNWACLVPLALAAVLGIWLGAVKLEIADMRVALQTQKADAAAKLLAAEAKTHAKEMENAELSRNMDARHIHDEELIKSTGSDFDRRVDERVRELSRRRSCNPTVVPGTATNPSQPPADAGGSDSELRGVDPASIRILRDNALKLQADFKRCFDLVHSWGH